MMAILFGVHIAQLWYSLPLLVSVSLVYAATRHELMGPILQHAIRFAISIGLFLSVILGILFLMSWIL
ncbi:MAG TPA: hypothetical protein VFE24_07645 [Pirellulales bacterium]|jgi:hypothetical protein|nr:hypothetical protein [Pirellulales bacterium]